MLLLWESLHSEVTLHRTSENTQRGKPFCAVNVESYLVKSHTLRYIRRCKQEKGLIVENVANASARNYVSVNTGIHTQEKTPNECGKAFYQKPNLGKHQKIILERMFKGIRT